MAGSRDVPAIRENVIQSTDLLDAEGAIGKVEHFCRAKIDQVQVPVCGALPQILSVLKYYNGAAKRSVGQCCK